MAEKTTPAAELLPREAIRLDATASDRYDAVRQAGTLLVSSGAVEDAYVQAMWEREESLSSYVGEGFAIPHGTDASRALVHRAGLAFLQFPEGVEWDGELVYACVAIAAAENEHVGVMSQLAAVLMDPEQAETLRRSTDVMQVQRLLTPQIDGSPAEEHR